MALVMDVGMTLQLEYWADELSPAQKSAYEKAEKEHDEIRNKLKEIVDETGGKNIFSGEVFTAYQVLGPVPGLERISQPVASLTRQKPPPVPPPLVLASTSRSATVRDASISPEASTSGRRRGRRTDDEVGPVLDLSMDDDDEDYTPLSKRMKQRDKDKSTTSSVTITRKPREEKNATPEARTRSPAASAGSTTVTVRPTEAGAIGGLQVGLDKDKKRVPAEASVVVDLTNDDGAKPTPDSREISFSKIQGKTFPSLVVIARPSLRVPEKLPTDRSQLDTKVKNVLVHPATKFTEWLIQQGLIKSDQFCKIHPEKALKLGMYSDVTKFPFSGGYFWISDCCPTRFTSVFSGSLFEGSAQPPSVILKLIYHWACQTNVSNVVNWVKVDNVYLKGLYTLLRSVCTVSLCRHMKLLGGSGKAIEIGVISLGTTTQDGQQRQVKVEVLGVMEKNSKLLRLRAVEPLTDGDRSYKKRFAKILEPLNEWVHKDSLILTDLTVDKGTLNSMGYKLVEQVSPAEANVKNSNANIMDYLRRIVPRMFQNTLSLLSRQIIQQFLNELVWREMYGTSPCTTFDNIVKHLSELTKLDRKESLIPVLNKASADPFKLKHFDNVPDASPASKMAAKRGRKPKDRSSAVSSLSPTITTTPVASSSKTSQSAASIPDPPKKGFLKKLQREAAPSSPPPTPSSTHRKTHRQQEREDTVTLEAYYYGSTGGNELKASALPCAEFDVWCPECPELTFQSNVDLLDHLLRHAHAPAADGDDRESHHVQCRCCLEYVADEDELRKHETLNHPLESKNPFVKTCNCIICEQRFSTVPVLVAHLQKSHLRLEMPYRCVGCDYRSSSLLATVNHFYDRHKDSALLQCPLCLRMACAYHSDCGSPGGPSEPAMDNVRNFLQHLREHTNKTVSKRCNKCALNFISKGEHKFHSIFAHVPSGASEDAVQPITTSVTEIAKPKKKVTVQKELTTYRLVKSYGQLELNMGDGSMCLECGNDFDEFNHMVGLVQCIKCPYRTLCLPSVVNHVTHCNPGASSSVDHPVYKLPQEMHCNCGFSSFDGYALARHLVVCDRGDGVFASVEAAQANVVKRSMLDMLGLIRRDEDEENGQDGAQVLARDLEREHAEAHESGEDDGPMLLVGSSFSPQKEKPSDSNGAVAAGECESGTTAGVSYDPSQSLYNIAGAGGDQQQFNTQLSLDDLGPPSVLPAQDNDRTPQLKDDYQSLATPRVLDQPDY